MAQDTRKQEARPLLLLYLKYNELKIINNNKKYNKYNRYIQKIHDTKRQC